MCSQAEGDDVLDVGCSQGIASLLLAREGRRVVGVDREIEALEFARSRLLDEEAAVKERTRFVHGEATALPFDDASFDTVLLGELLEHQIHVRPPLDEARRVLRPGGRLVITVPYGEHEHHDHKQALYLGDLLDVLAADFALDTVVLIDRYVGLAGSADSRNSTVGKPMWREALRTAERRLRAQDTLVEEQRAELREIRSDARKLYGHRQETDKLRAEIKGLEARLADQEQHRAQLEALFERLTKHSERWSARAATLEERDQTWRERDLRAKEDMAVLRAELARLEEDAAVARSEGERWSSRAATLEERDQRWRERDARHKRQIVELEERLALRARQLADIHATRWYRLARLTWRLRRRVRHPLGGGAPAPGGPATAANGASSAPDAAGRINGDGAGANGAAETEPRDRIAPPG
jgi:2-polyprenyl-6-hydroxyphenyl methylase/3-demethylubiquinone-9 3-methyltransferase